MEQLAEALRAPAEREERPEQGEPLRSAELPGLQSLHLLMGSQCNVHCYMCYQTHRKAFDNMPRELYAERLLPVYPQLRRLKLQGGEPTVMRNCREAAELLRRFPQVRISMVTNGIRLDEFWRERLLEQGEELCVSLNAASEEAYRKIVKFGDYRRVLGNLRALLAARRGGHHPRVAITAVILKEMIHELAAFVRLGGELGVESVRFAMDPVLSPAALPERAVLAAELEAAEKAAAAAGLQLVGLEPLHRRVAGKAPPRAGCSAAGQCSMPFEQAVVDSAGRVRVCVATWLEIGNVYEQDFADVWNGPRATSMREKIARGEYTHCEPYCPHNRNPSSAALLRKYATYCTRDPGQFAEKLKQKVQQLRHASA